MSIKSYHENYVKNTPWQIRLATGWLAFLYLCSLIWFTLFTLVVSTTVATVVCLVKVCVYYDEKNKNHNNDW